MREMAHPSGGGPVLTRRSVTAAIGMLAAIGDPAAAQTPAVTPFPTGASFRQIGTYGLERLAQITEAGSALLFVT